MAAKHHFPVGPKPHPESADTYCECGSEDCWPGFEAPWQHLDEIRARVSGEKMKQSDLAREWAVL